METNIPTKKTQLRVTHWWQSRKKAQLTKGQQRNDYCRNKTDEIMNIVNDRSKAGEHEHKSTVWTDVTRSTTSLEAGDGCSSHEAVCSTCRTGYLRCRGCNNMSN